MPAPVKTTQLEQLAIISASVSSTEVKIRADRTKTNGNLRTEKRLNPNSKAEKGEKKRSAYRPAAAILNVPSSTPLIAPASKLK